jgi:hypothetical protein
MATRPVWIALTLALISHDEIVYDDVILHFWCCSKKKLKKMGKKNLHFVLTARAG